MTILLISLLIIFLAALVKTTLGFGEALLAMPLLTLTLGLVTATPVVGLLGLLLSGRSQSGLLHVRNTDAKVLVRSSGQHSPATSALHKIS